MELVMAVCDLIWVLDAGKVIASGTPDEVRNNPAVLAAYLGRRRGGGCLMLRSRTSPSATGRAGPDDVSLEVPRGRSPR